MMVPVLQLICCRKLSFSPNRFILLFQFNVLFIVSSLNTLKKPIFKNFTSSSRCYPIKESARTVKVLGGHLNSNKYILYLLTGLCFPLILWAPQTCSRLIGFTHQQCHLSSESGTSFSGDYLLLELMCIFLLYKLRCGYQSVTYTSLLCFIVLIAIIAIIFVANVSSLGCYFPLAFVMVTGKEEDEITLRPRHRRTNMLQLPADKNRDEKISFGKIF